MKKTAIYHSRKTFYNGRDIYWYQLICHPSFVPLGFLQIPEMELYEYGGTLAEAIKELTDAGFNSII